MNKQKTLEIFNSMEIVDSESDGEVMICIYVENSQENREKLLLIGFSETQIDNALYDHIEKLDVIDLNHFVWNCAEWFDGAKFLDRNPNI
ncbi:hypothetical protein [Rossellomorea marisflavi]|uniref:hypothetical protein n=1 Tax=Rossellomorea marisflavi TaxID=189381 RepID=UPI00345DD602